MNSVLFPQESTDEPLYALVCPKNRVDSLTARLLGHAPKARIRNYANLKAAIGDPLAWSAAAWVLWASEPDELANYPRFHGLNASDAPPALVVISPDHWTLDERGTAYADGAFFCLSEGCHDTEFSTAVGAASCLAHTKNRLHAADMSLAKLADVRSRELYAAREDAQALLDFVSDMVFMVRPEPPEYPIVRASNVAARMLQEHDGIQPGTPLSRYLAGDSQEVFANIIGRLRERLQDAFELKFRARDAEPIRTMATARALHRGDSIEIVLVCTLAENDSQRAQRRATDSQRLRLMAARTGMAVYDVDVRETTIEFGGGVQELMGFTAKELDAYQSGRWMFLIHPQDRPRAVKRYSDAVDSVTKYEMEYRLRHKDGHYIHVEDTGVCIPGKDGRTSRVLGTIRDISHRVEQEIAYRKAEEARLHSQKLESLGVLAGGIAHDFNNILAAIIGLTSLALRDVEEGSDLHSDLSEVLQAGNRARDLVRQILDFSRQSGVERAHVELHQIAGEVLRLVQAGLPPTIRIESSLDRHAGRILANPAQMHQVILNYCMNAIHAMRESGGVLRVSVSSLALGESAGAIHPRLSPGTYVRLTVSDNGHGMSPHVRERVFDPFYTTKGPGEGTGMGLAVVHGIVAMHGGVIDVQSSPGEGATFTTYFPLSESGAAEPEKKEESPPLGREHVVVIRTDEVIGAFVVATLRHQGYSTEEFNSVATALKDLESQAWDHVDLVIADAGRNAPGMKEFLRACEMKLGGRPVMLLDHETIRQGKGAADMQRFIHVVEKPLTFEQLARVTRSALDAAKAPATA